MSKPKIDESKFKYLCRDKLHKQYLTNFLTEIWNVPLPKLEEFIAKFYPAPSALEVIELNELKKLIRKSVVSETEDGEIIEPEMLNEDDWKLHLKRQERMYGKEIQPIELSGSEGKALELTSMTKEQVNEALREEMDKVAKVMENMAKKKKKKK